MAVPQSPEPEPTVAATGNRPSQDPQGAGTAAAVPATVVVPPTHDRFAATVDTSDEPAAEALDFVGTQGLGQYHEQRLVGRWRYGELLEAVQMPLARRVRLRTLDLESAGAAGVREAFLATARGMAALNHPHVETGVLEAIGDGPTPYLAQEPSASCQIDGLGPRRGMDRSRTWLYSNATLARCLREACSGLQAIHEAELTHGHLDATTILVDPATNRVRLAGLGLMPDAEGVGRILGDAAALDARRRDLFDLAAAFWHFVTHEQFDARWLRVDRPALLARRLRRRNPGVSRELATALARCLAIHAAECERIDTPAALALAVEPATRRRVELASPADRLGSALFELPIAVPIVGLSFGLASVLGPRLGELRATLRGVAPGLIGAPDPSAVFAVVLAASYAGLEIGLGRTLGRSLRGLSLVDRSGERPDRLRLFARVVVQYVSWFILAAVLARIISPLLRLAWPGIAHVPTPPVFLEDWLGGHLAVISASIVAGYLVLQATARWLPSRRPIHDWLSGVTWGCRRTVESPTVTLPPSTADGRRGVVRSLVAEPAIEPTERIDQFALHRELGRGGMGTVYAARDEVLGREVALKLIATGQAAGLVAIRRFEQEASLAARINHPNVARIFRAGVSRGRPFIVMEFLDGEDLHQHVERVGPVPLAAAWNYVRQAAEGLREAERLGIVHRDVKPSNLMLTRDGTVKVLDFGVSKLLGEVAEAEGEARKESDGSVHLTRTGALLGTPQYMSPEQALGRPLDNRGDIYSLGLTLYYLLTGKAPFEARDVPEMTRMQATAPLPALVGRLREWTPERAALLDRMAAKNPADRFQSYDDLITELVETAPRPLPRARLVDRFRALVVDLVLVFTPVAALGKLALVALTGTGNAELLEGLDPISDFMAVLVLALLEGGRVGTLGKRIMRLRVVRPDGRPPGFLRSLARQMTIYAFAFVTSLCALLFGTSANPLTGSLVFVAWVIPWLVSAYLIAETPSMRALHDRLVGTDVVQLPRRRKRGGRRADSGAQAGPSGSPRPPSAG